MFEQCFPANFSLHLIKEKGRRVLVLSVPAQYRDGSFYKRFC